MHLKSHATRLAVIALLVAGCGAQPGTPTPRPPPDASPPVAMDAGLPAPEDAAPGAVDASPVPSDAASGPARDASRDASPSDAAVGVEPSAEMAACQAYLIAKLNRLHRTCSGHEALPDNVLLNYVGREGAFDELEGCPDLLFATDTAWTIESALQCAKEWQSFSCDDAARGSSPSCVVGGLRKTGAPCSSDLQCEDKLCHVSRAGECSWCAELVARGEPCQDVSFPDKVCPQGYECSYAPGHAPDAERTCVYADKQPLLGLHDAGELCEVEYGRCLSGLSCEPEPEGGLSRCRQPQGPPAGPGETCDDRGCADGLWCDDFGKCVPLPVEGEECVYGAGGELEYCAPGHYCDSTIPEDAGFGGTPRCRREHGPNEACAGTGCSEGFVCDRSESRCVQYRRTGERCDEAWARCKSYAGDRCQDGICVYDPALVCAAPGP